MVRWARHLFLILVILARLQFEVYVHHHQHHHPLGTAWHPAYGTIIRRSADLKVQRGALCVCSMKDLFLHGVLALLLLLLACLALPCACLYLPRCIYSSSFLSLTYLRPLGGRSVSIYIIIYLYLGRMVGPVSTEGSDHKGLSSVFISFLVSIPLLLCGEEQKECLEFLRCFFRYGVY